MNKGGRLVSLDSDNVGGRLTFNQLYVKFGDMMLKVDVDELKRELDNHRETQVSVRQLLALGGRREPAAIRAADEECPFPYYVIDAEMVQDRVRDRMELAPADSLEPAFKSLAERQVAHYVERWPLLALPAALDQPEEIVACRAMAVTSKGIMLIRDAQEDEKPSTEEARRASYERSLRVESAVKALLVSSEEELPIHVLTVGTHDRYLDQSLGTGIRTRCDTADGEIISKWSHEASRGQRYDLESTDEAWSLLIPNIDGERRRIWSEKTLGFAVAAEDMPELMADIESSGEVLALRIALLAAHPEANVRGLLDPEPSNEDLKAASEGLVQKGWIPPFKLREATVQGLDRLEELGLYKPPPGGGAMVQRLAIMEKKGLYTPPRRRSGKENAGMSR